LSKVVAEQGEKVHGLEAVAGLLGKDKEADMTKPSESLQPRPDAVS